MRRALVVLVASVLGVATQAGLARADGTTLESVSGWSEQQGLVEGVDVLVEVPPGADQQQVGQQALAVVHASPTPPSDLFTTSGFVWGQFFDHRYANNRVVQYYNPIGDPTGGAGLAALRAAQQAWSSVAGSSFRYAFGGTTTRCPSLFFGCGSFSADGYNDVGWHDLGNPDILAMTITLFNRLDGTIRESDVVLNPNAAYRFTTDGTGIDLQTTITHEDGHAAGLGHSPDPAAVMYPFLAVGQVKRALSPDDADAMRFLYPVRPSTAVSTRANFGFRVLDVIGAGTNDRMNDFEPGSLNAHGDAAYVADVATAGGDVGEGVFVASGSGVTQLARSGQTVDGLTLDGGVDGRVGMNDAGDVAFSFQLGPGLGFAGALFRYSAAAGSTAAIVVPGVTAAPGGGVFQDVGSARISNRGEIVFEGVVDGSVGVYAVAPDGTLSTVMRAGDSLPGGGAAVDAFTPALNDLGDVVFLAHPAGASAASLYLRHARTGVIDRIAAASEPAPGGGTLQRFVPADVNARGEVLFAGDLTPPPRRYRQIGIFLYTASGTVAIARPGDLMPDGSHVITGGSVNDQLSLNDSGQAAFVAKVDSDIAGDGLADTAVYRFTHGRLELVARSGMVIPDIGDIVQIQPLAFFFQSRPFGGAVIDARGDVLFQAVTGLPTTPGSDPLKLLTASPTP